MKPPLWPLTAATLILILFAASAAPLAAETKLPIKVGVITPMTGEFASWGEGIRRSIELFTKSRTGTFSFVFEDEGNCQAKEAVSAYRKLSAQGIHFMILGCLSGTKAILPIAKKDSVLLFSAGLLDDEVFKQTDQLINLATQISTESISLAQRVHARGLDRVAIIHWIDDFANEFATTLAKALTRNGISVVANEGVDPKERDYRSLLIRLKKSNPGAICFNIGQDQQEILLRQISELGIKVPIFSNYVFENPAALKMAALASEVEYSFPVGSAEGATAKETFDQEYTSHFGPGNTPTPNSYFVWDGLLLLENARAKCGSTDPSCVANYFRSVEQFSGVSGIVSFHADGSNDRPYGIKKVVNNQFVWLAPAPAH